jgi:hypothetical protein
LAILILINSLLWLVVSIFRLIYKSHFSSVEYLINKYPNDTFIICEDYNIPEVTWDNDNNSIGISFTSSASASCIPESFSTNFFFQKNIIYNSNKSIFDIFCNDKYIIVKKSFEPLVPIDKYDLVLDITLSFIFPFLFL